MTGCMATSLDGHEHAGETAEYVRICVNDHERAGWLCAACTGAAGGNTCGIRPAKCTGCGDLALLVPRAEWDRFAASEAVT
ncbi:MAG: hypothetical protein M3Y33_14025 [Actinomycetota bacterium]|nr:hypothetical protein [Actinomycetota bacterium]